MGEAGEAGGAALVLLLRVEGHISLEALDHNASGRRLRLGELLEIEGQLLRLWREAELGTRLEHNEAVGDRGAEGLAAEVGTNALGQRQRLFAVGEDELAGVEGAPLAAAAVGVGELREDTRVGDGAEGVRASGRAGADRHEERRGARREDRLLRRVPRRDRGLLDDRCEDLLRPRLVARADHAVHLR